MVKKGLVIVMVFMLCLISLYAREKDGSISIDFHGIGNNDESIILSSVPFTLYPIAIHKDEQLIINKEYEKLSISIDEIDQSSKRNEIKRIYNYILNNDIKGYTQYTDNNGKLCFDHLKQGVYLISQSEGYKYKDGYFISIPFVINLPLENDGYLVYDITVEPKNEWQSSIKQVPNSNIDTSDDNKVESYLCLLILSGFMIFFMKKYA